MHPRIGVLQLFQRTHEDMEAAVRLQVARHIGHDRVARLERCAVGRDQRRRGIGPERLVRDAFVLDDDLVLQCVGVAAALPLGGADRRVALREVQGMKRVPGSHPGAVVERGREFRVEIQVGALPGVVPLAQVHQARVGERILGVQRLAPACRSLRGPGPSHAQGRARPSRAWRPRPTPDGGTDPGSSDGRRAPASRAPD